LSTPNVLLIHSDQHRFDCVGVNQPHVPAGPGRLLKTPHLDSLAASGANFTHAFTPIPICTPARASLATGTWASQHDSWVIPNTLGYSPAPDRLPNLYRLLSDKGYRVAHIAKYHQELTGTPLDHGAAAFFGEDAYDHWRREQHLPSRPMTNGFWGEADPIDDSQSRVAWGADHTIEQMQAARGEGKPFFVRWDPSEPHLPNVLCEPWASMVKASDVPPWASFADTLANKPVMQRLTRQRWGCDEWTWADWQPIVARYLGEIMQLDHHIGRVLAALEHLGIAHDTLVIYSTDHGDFCGGHGMVDKHYTGYDDILRVPLIMRFPDRIARGVTCDRFVAHEIDLARTIVDLTCDHTPATFVGRNLLAEIDGSSQPRPDIFVQYGGTQQGRVDQRYLRTGRWKYVYCPVSDDELYDLDADPGELTNLINAPEHATTLLELRKRMMQWMSDTQDRLSGPLWRWPPRLKP
jgi:arylsulfatase A-like enzyme